MGLMTNSRTQLSRRENDEEGNKGAWTGMSPHRLQANVRGHGSLTDCIRIQCRHTHSRAEHLSIDSMPRINLICHLRFNPSDLGGAVHHKALRAPMRVCPQNHSISMGSLPPHCNNIAMNATIAQQASTTHSVCKRCCTHISSGQCPKPAATPRELGEDLCDSRREHAYCTRPTLDGSTQ
jgi:hypothetical protein